jgi:hypothetical protein
VHVQQLQHFAFGNLVGGVGQDAHHQHRIQLHHHLEAARIEEIAHQHAGRIAPQRVGGLAPAPQVGFVHHVVVQQGGGVDELDHGRQRYVLRAGIAAGTRREQMQHRAQALAARGHDVFSDLVDQQHIRRQAGADQVVHGRHVGGGQGLHIAQRRHCDRRIGEGGIHGRKYRGERLWPQVRQKSQPRFGRNPSPPEAPLY